MAEALKLKKVEKVEEKPKRKRKHKDISISEITPEIFKKTWRVIKLLAMIPLSLIAGLFVGLIEGFVKCLETALEIYKEELGK